MLLLPLVFPIVVFILIPLSLSAVSLLVTLPLVLMTECLPPPLWRAALVRHAGLAIAASLAFLISYGLIVWISVELTIELSRLNIEFTSSISHPPNDYEIHRQGIAQELGNRILFPPNGNFCYTQNITVCEILNHNSEDANQSDWIFYLIRLGMSSFSALVAGILHRKLYVTRNRFGWIVTWLALVSLIALLRLLANFWPFGKG